MSSRVQICNGKFCRVEFEGKRLHCDAKIHKTLTSRKLYHLCASAMQIGTKHATYTMLKRAYDMEDKTMNTITMLSGGRFIASHIGCTVYYDSRHKVIKTRLSGGGFAELVKERQNDGTWSDQMFVICNANGERHVTEFERPDQGAI
jgi:hypothetical protein